MCARDVVPRLLLHLIGGAGEQGHSAPKQLAASRSLFFTTQKQRRRRICSCSCRSDRRPSPPSRLSPLGRPQAAPGVHTVMAWRGHPVPGTQGWHCCQSGTWGGGSGLVPCSLRSPKSTCHLQGGDGIYGMKWAKHTSTPPPTTSKRPGLTPSRLQQPLLNSLLWNVSKTRWSLPIGPLTVLQSALRGRHKEVRRRHPTDRTSARPFHVARSRAFIFLECANFLPLSPLPAN